jgi:hypothetical protein
MSRARRLVAIAREATTQLLTFLDIGDLRRAAKAAIKAAEAYVTLTKGLPGTSRVKRLATTRAELLVRAAKVLKEGRPLPADLEYAIRDFEWRPASPPQMHPPAEDPAEARWLELRRVATQAYQQFLEKHPDRQRLTDLAHSFQGRDASMWQVEFLEAAALYYHVRDKTAYVTGTGRQSSRETLYVGGGQCLEQARLLVDLLRSLNLKAHLLASELLRHAIVGIELKAIPDIFHSAMARLKGELLLLVDTTCQNCTFGELPDEVVEAKGSFDVWQVNE